jgi:hypothetical protein
VAVTALHQYLDYFSLITLFFWNHFDRLLVLVGAAEVSLQNEIAKTSSLPQTKSDSQVVQRASLFSISEVQNEA